MRKLGSQLYRLILPLPLVGALLWSLWPAGVAFLAIARFTPPQAAREDWDDPERAIELKRQIQKNFLINHLYIPLEDIVGIGQNHSHDALATLTLQACGRGRLFVWVPLRFRLPVMGDRVVEWCWKQKN